MSATDRLVSTSDLPPVARIQALLDDAHDRYRANDDGRPASHYPVLAAVPRNLFGLAMAAVDGQVHVAGDADHPFTIMSVAKPFVLALVCEAIGVEAVKAKVGVDSTGLAFDSIGSRARIGRARSAIGLSSGPWTAWYWSSIRTTNRLTSVTCREPSGCCSANGPK